MPVAGLSRLLSFEENDGQQLHLEISPRLLRGAAAAESSDTLLPGAAEPLSLPPAQVGPPAAPPGSERQQVCRAQKVEQLQEYLLVLSRLGSAGGSSGGGSSGLVHFPAEFPGLVQQLRQARLAEFSEQRGWLARSGGEAPAAAAGAFSSSSAPAATIPATPTSQDPKLVGALLKMRQLDGALSAASQRAIAVAAAGWEREQRPEQGGSNEPAAVDAAGGDSELIVAMRRERCRLQQQERLREALQEGGAGQQGRGGEMSQQQELLLEALLSGGLQQGERTPSNAYVCAEAADELSAIDAALAALGAGRGLGGAERQEAGTAATLPAVPLACDAHSERQEGDEDLVASREGFLRAQGESRCMAQKLRSIDAALRALKTGASTAVVATAAVAEC